MQPSVPNDDTACNAEGISYLVVLGIIAWSISTKVKTGSGLPAGPNGLLGAVEGISYLSLLGGEQWAQLTLMYVSNELKFRSHAVLGQELQLETLLECTQCSVVSDRSSELTVC